MASPVGSPPRCCPIWARRPSAIATSRWRRRRSTTRARSVERPCPSTASTARASARSSTARPRPPLSALVSALAGRDRPASPHRLTVPPPGACHVTFGKAPTSARRLLVAPPPTPLVASPRHVEPFRAPSIRWSPLHAPQPRPAPRRLEARRASFPRGPSPRRASFPSGLPLRRALLLLPRPRRRSSSASCRSDVVGDGGRSRTTPCCLGPHFFLGFELFQAVYSRWTIPDGIVHLECRKREKNVPVADRTMRAVTI